MQPSGDTTVAAPVVATGGSAASQKAPFQASKSEWRYAAIYLLTLSAVGLNFYPALLVMLVMLVQSFRQNRYDFLIQLTLFFGGYALTSSSKNFHNIKPDDMALVLSVGLMFFCRSTKIVKGIVALFFSYFIILVALASTSDEVMSIQLNRIRNYLGFIYLFVPWTLFYSKDNFDIHELWRKVILYSLILCIFYVLDGLVVRGHLFVSAAAGGEESMFWKPEIWRNWVRIYPPGMYWLALCILPISKFYTLRKWQWAMVLLAFVAIRTFSVIIGLVVVYILMQGTARSRMRYLVIGTIAFTMLFFVDRATGDYLRIASSINQFLEMKMPEEIESEEDIEKVVTLGSGRMTQIIPKFELLFSEDREWVGLGFLHPEKTKATKFIVDNHYYTDMSKSEEVATGVEVCMLQTILDAGFIGLAVQCIIYLLIGWVMRRQRWVAYYWSVLLAFTIFGVAGFSGLIYAPTLLLLGVVIAAVCLGPKKEVNDEAHTSLTDIQENTETNTNTKPIN